MGSDLNKARKDILELLKTNCILVVLRGLPGSGKTTFAKNLLDDSMEITLSGLTRCSADDYFLRPDGTYDWNPKYLKNAHEYCFKQVEEAMSLDNMSWLGPCDLIVLDNTNIVRSHYKKYLDLAEQMNYTAVEVIVGSFDDDFIRQCAERNTHGVSLETIEKMAKKFEV